LTKASSGFTLIEILVALAIVTTGLSALTIAMSGFAGRAQTIENKVLSTWVASNRFAELRLARIWPGTGVNEGQATLGGRTWYYRENVTATADEAIRRVDVRVFEDQDREIEVGYMFGYLTRP